MKTRDLIGINPHRAPWNDRTTSWDTTDPNLKPVAQSEFSFGAEKKVSEEISFSARLVYKHLLQTIEDVGILEKNAFGGESEQYYIANPGMGWVLPVSKGGKFEDRFWESPKAKREYYGIFSPKDTSAPESVFRSRSMQTCISSTT